MHYQSSSSSTPEDESRDDEPRKRGRARGFEYLLSSSRTILCTSNSHESSESDENEEERFSFEHGMDTNSQKELGYDQSRLKGIRYRERPYDSRSRSISSDESRSKRNKSESTSYDQTTTSNLKCTSTLEGLEAKKAGNRITSRRKEKNLQQRPSSSNSIPLPSYYNRKAINPNKYAEQIRKKKLLWGMKAKSEGDETCKHNKSPGEFWEKATLDGDQDGKMTAKFKRLMGIKSTDQGDSRKFKVKEDTESKNREGMFDSMESQYEAARLATHTLRGVGLGFGTFQFHTR